MKLEPYLSDEIIPDLNNIVRDIEDEGDRCYFGSTNDADRLREIADWLEANFRRTPPASQSDEALVADSGMSADVVEAAELLWTQLPTGRKWTSLPTREKALICHILTACITSARHDGINKVLAFLRDNEPDEELAGCPALWSDFVQIAEARFCDMTENTND